MTSPILTVIIPAYNIAPYIENCLDSILNQTIKNIEIIVVNDGSTDNTLESLYQKYSSFPNIRIINKINEGVSTARNEGLNLASGKYLMFVDGDDYLSPDCCEYFIDMIESNQAEFAFSLNCFTKRGERQIKNDCIESISPIKATTILLSPKVIVGSWNKIYLRRFIIDNGILFDPSLFYGEGLRFITQVSQLAKKIVVGRRKVYYYRRNNYSSATSTFNIKKLINGEKSLDLILSDLQYNNKDLIRMLKWHICQFKMGIVIRLIEANQESQYNNYYRSALNYIRKKSIAIMFFSKVSLYKRLLILGTSISPNIMAMLDNIRRTHIAKTSVIGKI